MIERHRSKYLADDAADLVVQSGIVSKFGRTRRMQGTISLKDREFADAVGRGLRKTDTALQLVTLVLVARGLATPGTTIGPHFTFFHTDDGAVVIQQHSTGNVLAPQSGMCTFARTALAQKQYRLFPIDNATAMDGQRTGEQGHEAISYPQGKPIEAQRPVATQPYFTAISTAPQFEGIFIRRFQAQAVATFPPVFRSSGSNNR